MIHLLKQALQFIMFDRRTFFIRGRIFTGNIILSFGLCLALSAGSIEQEKKSLWSLDPKKSFERGTKSMKRFSLVTGVVIMTLMLAIGTSWGYEAQKTTGGLTVTLSAGSYPLVKGGNDLSVKVTDGSGKAVTDAKVTVRFFMPPMPGMAPMSSKSEAALKGDVYRFTANADMEGTWKTEVVVERPGKSAVTAVFNLDAR
jgi:hypothetical protein